MVFESLVSDLLNKFIGDYVENLDKSQLKIGIWSGNVVLENLKVKENALSEFDVPFRVKAGQIGKLTLKIPWKNLYNDAVVATLDGLYLLVVPGATIKYDAVKEDRYQQELKQRELQRIEDALQMAARRASQTGDLLFDLETVVYRDPHHVSKGHKKQKKRKKGLKKLKRHDNKPEKPQEEKKDTFMEKLATQVIKNLQVKISSIHLRYEDDLSDPQRPLSMGVTLSELSLQTTDENWKACILNEAAKIIYKLGRLECLCAYWNVNSPMFYKGSWEDIVVQLKSGISSKQHEQPHYQYIFRPIFASAKMCINPNAELELKTPKAQLHLEVQNIAIEMTKPQYLTMVDVLESIDCMVKNAPYRKFRPDIPVHRNAKVWWKYFFNSILEVHIRRCSHMWSWTSIKQHRDNLRAYRSAYKTKLLNPSRPSPETDRQIQDLEKVLDVFNITLARQQAQMEVIRSGQKLVAKKAAGGQKQGGWSIGSWFSRRSKKEEQEPEESKEEQSSGLDEIMTTEEKEKLYTAIGYSGSSHNLALPKQYVAIVVTFQLLKTSVTIREQPDVPEILQVQIIDLSTKISQRPGAQAIRVEAALEHWFVTGLQQQGAVPSLITSVGDSTSSLLSVMFEINPEDSSADQMLRVHSQPVEIIYDALTVNSMAEFFKTGKGVDLEVLTSATLSKLEEIKEKTATGLSHIIETRKVLDLKVDLKPSYLLLPKSGFYSNTSDLIIVDFGSLQFNSVEQSTRNSSSSSFSSLEEIMDRAYERFSVELRRVQVLYTKSGGAWKAARLQGSSVQHILQPMDFTVQLAKCMVEKDARMPRFKVSGELPLLHVKISDQKIQNVLELVDSIPLPNMNSAPSTPTEKVLSLAEARPRVLDLHPSILHTMETDSDEDTSEKSLDEDHQRSVLEELTEFQFKFEVKEVLLELTQQADQEKTILALSVCQLGAEGKGRSFDLSVTSYLHRVTLDYCDVPGGRSPLHLISSSEQHGSDLLKVEYVKADPAGPSFQTLFDNTEQTLKVEFSTLDFLLHTKALLCTVNFLNGALPPQFTATRERDAKKQVVKAGQGRTVSKGGKDGGIFTFKLFAMLGCFHVEVCDDRRSIADIRIQGIDASVLVQVKETEVFARLRDIVVTDVNPTTIHRKAVSIVGEEVFSFKLSLFPGATEGDGYSDMSQVDGKVTMRLGCIQIVYLHQFLMSLLASFSVHCASADEMFIDNFQTAKQALSAATAQAAEKAASSVRDFAQKSFRLSTDIKLKAPLIIIPQSSISQNAVMVDLGLITVGNSFCLHPTEGFDLPAVVEKMEVKLTQLKLSRTCMDPGSGRPSIELLEPVNLRLSVRRNLAASWYKKMAAVEIDGDMKPMKSTCPPPKVELSQGDLKVLLRILTENLGEASSLEPTAPRQETVLQVQASGGPPTEDVGKQSIISSEDEDESLETIKFNFNIESLGLVLYSNDPKQPLGLQHQENLRLGRFALHLLKASGKVLNNGSMEVSTILTDCTLDDLRVDMDRVTSRMIGRRDEESGEVMIDVTYRQNSREREVVAVLQKLHVCASVEFLMAVGEFFLQALPQGQTPPTGLAQSERLPLRQTTEPRSSDSRTAPVSKMRVRAVVVDPEVVFVANLMKADAPALVVYFQCDFSLQAGENGGQNMRANLRELKVLACPFICNKDDKAVTTVLRPCSVALETKTHPNQPLSGSVTVEEVIVKISPFILNTVMTITAAMTTKQRDEQSQQSTLDVNNLWSVMNIFACNFWFLGVDQATEITESFREQDGRNEGENFAAQIKVVQVTLESGLGHRTVPLLLAESSFSGSAKNWSSLLKLRADMTLEVNYFNEVHAVWEPLIERVDSGRRRWNLELEMKNNPVQDRSPVHGDDFVILPEPRTAVNICSKDTMNITISQCSLNVFQNLAKAFSVGTASTFDYSLNEKAPFTIKNALGIPLIVQHSANLRPVRSVQQGKLHELAVNQSMDLEHSVFEASSRGKLSALQRQESCLFNLSIVPSGYSEISNISVDKPGRRLYNIRGPMLQEAVSVLMQIDAAEGNKVITVRSPLQIKNHFSVPFTILKYCPTSKSLQIVGQAEPEREFHIALETYRCQLFLRPAGCLDGQYGPSSTCVSWKEQVHRSSEVRSMLQCPATDSSLLPLMVSILAVPDDLRHIDDHGEEDWDPAYVIHLHPVATLRNLLPYTIRYMLESSADSYELQEGSTSDLLNARISGEIMSLVLKKYQGRDWHGHVRIEQDIPEFFAVCLTCDSDTSMTVDVNLHISRTASRLVLSLFSPYWIINKTSRVLQYRAEDVSVKHPADYRDIILFSFKKKTLFSKSKLQLCVSTSSWSDGFSLDTVGSYGCVRCPGTNMDYLVGVSIQMSSFNLTRIVTMSPFYTLVNKSSYELEVGEVLSQTSTRWHYIASTECVPLWPENTSGQLCVRVVGSESASKSFFFNKQDSGTLLKLDVCGGLIVDTNNSDHSTVISFSDYYEGAAPALLINHTPWVTISYKQSGSTVVRQLKPGEAQRFAWDDPAGVRMLSWSCMEHSGELDLLKDEVGQFSYDSLSQVHWVSFLDGRQRVLLFTEDVSVVTKARQAEELEQFEQEVRVSLQNLGLSLVNNSSRQEIAYIGITSSGVVWEMKPKNRWKPFSQKNINLLEKTYQNQLSGKTEGGWVKLETNLEVNLGSTTMMMRQPIHCPVRRNFLSGIQVEFKQSQHQRSLRAQLHWLQVDNQLPGAIFPIIFHPVPPPKSIALDSEPKPFIDVSIITRFNQHSNVMQFKYFMALVQEMAVKIDQGFLTAILALFTPAADPQADKQKSRLIDRDVQMLQAELMEASLTDTSGLSFFEHFHISPIKLHLSLSLGSSGEDAAQETAAVQSLNLLLKSIGATLTDVDDLIFKLAFFEVKYQFYRREKLMWAVVRHYSEQFLKQMYVLVLGLDVLGNPFGLIRGLSEGVEAFFYEPFQGAVQGPEEFAEGFVIGVRSLLGHTVGGAAGMVSRITGSVGKGLAAITMDKEYQQKRREEMNRPPKDFGESLAKGGKGLLKGVVGGVTGIVTKPVEGAKKEGAAGFFKGIGKGLVGVVARPTGGIVDMASSTFQGIQRGHERAAESTEEVTKLRPVRLIREDGIIRPYDLTESKGYDLFQRSEIKQLDGEVFRDHCPYPGHRKTNIIVTNRRVVCMKEVDFVNHFHKEWECLFENFYRPPAVMGTELKIYCKDQQKLKLPKKDGQEAVRTVQLGDTNTAQKLQAAISDAQVARQQHRMARQKSQRFLKPTNKQ
ncbi:vacuolar protein sorting-associated protein 13C isoform X10 [Sphaeramia orbicularis]|uniref:vacuolar protein sorting-associated protein 13C isoform X10 n=1 Tax=Sphaeramia orbicularis TaxID=375764 RepID=UPI00117EB545|nr:vacuolar protein sorting-associated protein 13C isoform X10 [Sphaeramia orbicularis]